MKHVWVERHDCLEMLLYTLEYIVQCLDQMADCVDKSWSWDNESIIKANGLRSSLRQFNTICCLVTLYESLYPLQGIAAKLQKRDLDVLEALNLVREAAVQVAKMREDIDTLWSEKWVSSIKQLCDKIGAVESMPRCTMLQRNRANTPADSPEEYYKRSLVIPFLDELSTQLKIRFTADDDIHVSSLFKLLPAFIKEVKDFKQLEQNLLFWEVDLPSPHGLLFESKPAFWGATVPAGPGSA